MSLLSSSFRNPAVAFRGKPFWSWNGTLDEAELIRQIHVLKEMGMGGFFMHSRTGLATEYLGAEWFRLTNACADEAERLGLEAWLYDEDRWPSGTAGGMVTADPRHRAKYLSLTFAEGGEPIPWADGVVAAFSCVREGPLLVRDVRRLAPGTLLPAGTTALVFRIEPLAESSFYNGATYVDTLSRAATDAYLAITHEQYLARCDGRIGRSIHGIFTDEPHRGAVMCGFSVPNDNRLWMTPWTDGLDEAYRQAFGDDLIERLPELFLRVDGEAVSPAKWRYMELLQRLFLSNFAEPMHGWCRRHGARLTGHVLHEDSLTAQSAMQGSLMRYYEHMDVPGIDILGEHNRCYWVAKQLDSVARQLGQPWRLSELYGCTGWQMNFAAHKAVGDWQALFGVNVRCHHLSWYTMAGEAKRDYPASISFQSAWWPNYRFVEDYFARLGVVMTHGRPVCETLVINPVESVWCQIHGGWANSLTPTQPAVQQLDARHAELFHMLAGGQIDFDYGDEEMLSRLGGVDRGGGRSALRLGRGAYRTVVVGHMTTMRQSTLRLLDAFVEAGGRVVFAGEPPAYVDAVRSPDAASLAARATRVSWDAAAVRAAVPRDVEILVGGPADSVFAQHRVDDDGTHGLILLNVDRERPTPPMSVRLRGVAGDVAEWRCETGERFAIEARDDGGGATFDVALPAGGLRAFAIGRGVAAGLAPLAEPVERRRRQLAGPFAYELLEPNVCVLDRGTYAIDDGPEQRATDVLRIDRTVRAAFGLPPRSGEMVQPWFRRKTRPAAPTLGRVRLTFAFDVEHVPATPVDLAVETPGRFDVSLNGAAVNSACDQGWWVDPVFRRVRLPALRAGRNELTLSADFDEELDLEAVYLLGDFGVRVDGVSVTLVALPATLAPTDVASQGLAFYGGPIRYRLPVPADASGRLMLELPGINAACARVGEATLAFHPRRAEVAAVDGEVTLDVVLTRRNTFGPLHQRPLLTPHYGPHNWVTEGDSWSDAYTLHPAGLQQPPVLIELD